MRLLYTTAILAVLATSCQKNKSITLSDIQLPATSQEPGLSQVETDSTYKLEDMVLQKSKTATPFDWDKKIIKTGNIVAEVNNYNAYNSAIHQTIKPFGAYIASESQAQTDGSIENTITIKVPVQYFEALMNSIGGDGVTIIERKITSEDVTGEVSDTKARTEAKKRIRDRYLDFLKQAKNITEVLQVQEKIDDLQEEIEISTGRSIYLVHQAALSTIHLRYYQQTAVVKTNDENSFFKKLKHAAVVGVDIVGNLFILLVSIWPLILLSIFIWLLWKRKKIQTLLVNSK